MEKTAIFLNPAAGQGKSLQAKEKISGAFLRAGLPHDLFVSTSEDHLCQLVRRARGKYPYLVAVGGDTTFKIVAGEILAANSRDRSQRPPVLGMIGTGSANDITRSLGIEQVADLCRAIRQGLVKDMDVGCLQVDSQPEPVLFLGNLSIGLGAFVNRYIDAFSRRHRWLRRSPISGQVLPGLMGIYRAFSRHQVPLTARLDTPGSSQDMTFSLLLVANIPFYANGLSLSPASTPFDGQMEAVIIHTRSFPRTLRFGWRVLRHRHRETHGFDIIPFPSLQLSFPGKLDIQVDGDIIPGVGNAHITLLKGVLPVFLNR